MFPLLAEEFWLWANAWAFSSKQASAILPFLTQEIKSSWALRLGSVAMSFFDGRGERNFLLLVYVFMIV